jgi:hypothetical protein
MNRYMNRYIGILALLLGINAPAYSQIKLDAPETVATGKKIVVSVDPQQTKDIRYTVLRDGKPFKEYLGFKSLDTDKPILLFTETEDGVYTVVASGTLNGKTDVAVSTTLVGEADKKPKPKPKPEPKPDDPIPPPTPVGFPADVKKLYDQSKDDAALDKLIQTFTDVKAYIPKLKNFGEFEMTIISTAQDRIKDNAKLRAVRDRIGDYLLEKVGNDPRKWD